MLTTIRLSGISTSERWNDVDDWLAQTGARPEAIRVDDDDPIRIMYTSGTESRPKGVVLGSRSLMWQCTSCISARGMEHSDIELHALPFYHCAQLDNFLSTDIYLGATSVIVRKPDPSAIFRTLAAEHVTNLFLPPTVWISLLRSEEFDSQRLSSLCKGYYGASAMPIEILSEMHRRLPKLRLWNFYGQTEMASLASALGPDDQENYAGSAGFPPLNVETRIADPSGEVLAAGGIGEIQQKPPTRAGLP